MPLKSKPTDIVKMINLCPVVLGCFRHRALDLRQRLHGQFSTWTLLLQSHAAVIDTLSLP